MSVKTIQLLELNQNQFVKIYNQTDSQIKNLCSEYKKNKKYKNFTIFLNSKGIKWETFIEDMFIDLR